MKKKDVSQELIVSHLPLVKMVAGRIFSRLPRHADFDNLVSCGVLGLMEASKDFNPENKVKFSTYAFYRIKGAMLDGLRALDWLPRSLRQKVQRLESAECELRNRLGREPQENELAEYLGMNSEEIRTLILDAQQSGMLSLEEELQEKVAFDLYLGSGGINSFEEEELIGILAEGIKGLEEKERLAITFYYYEGLNLKEIGGILDLSESRISQLLSKGIRHLQQKLGYLRSEIRK